MVTPGPNQIGDEGAIITVTGNFTDTQGDTHTVTYDWGDGTPPETGTVIQGEAAEFKVPLPEGFEVTAASGNTLESNDVSANMLTLRVHDPAKRTHQFLIAMERTNRETKIDAPLLAFKGAQRETGEVLVEGTGAMEMTAIESGGMRRMDVKEAGAITRSLSHYPLQAAFRYNRRATDAPKLQLEWRQFQDADVLSAVAERATVTTLANVEGRSLTEVTLRVRNHAQPFVRVELPPGAQLVTAEVEGQTVRPVEGGDGKRVPLQRPGLNASGAYTVSFVYLSSGTRFARAPIGTICARAAANASRPMRQPSSPPFQE